MRDINMRNYKQLKETVTSPEGDVLTVRVFKSDEDAFQHLKQRYKKGKFTGSEIFQSKCFTQYQDMYLQKGLPEGGMDDGNICYIYPSMQIKDNPFIKFNFENDYLSLGFKSA